MKIMRSRSVRGVSLIETMVSVGIFTVGILGVFTGINYASSQNSAANRLTGGAGIAAKMRANVVNRGFTGFERAVAGVGNGLTCSTTNPCLAGSGDFKVTGNEDLLAQGAALDPFFRNPDTTMVDFRVDLGATSPNLVRFYKFPDDTKTGARYRRYAMVVSPVASGTCLNNNTVAGTAGCFSDQISLIVLWKTPGAVKYSMHVENVTLLNTTGLKLGEEVNY